MRTPKVLFPLLVLWLSAAGCQKKAPPPPPPPKVEVLTVLPRDVPIYQEWIATLDGYPNAQIHAQVSGYLKTQNYQEGGVVKHGDLLFEIDPRPFQAALDQALAKQHQDEAQLEKTALDVKRFTPLARTQAISQQQLDDAVQANLVAKAGVTADKAAVESAQLNLGFTRIISPVDGVAGLAQAQIGDLVGPTTGTLTTVSTVNPLRAYFNISEQFYLAFFRPGGSGARGTLRENPVQLILADGSTFPTAGKWIITGRNVDPSTGTIEAAAEFENPDNFLRPGQHALVRAQTEMRSGALAVPQRAVIELQGAYQVAVVDAADMAHFKNVRVGQQIGTEWLIESGLQPNDRVVVEGTQKVKDGVKVQPVEYNAGAGKGSSPTAAAAGGKSG
jgi:membrane fusion protein (multidrug efflux system)